MGSFSAAHSLAREKSDWSRRRRGYEARVQEADAEWCSQNYALTILVFGEIVSARVNIVTNVTTRVFTKATRLS